MADRPKLVLPKHLGLILDGNRRWATEQNLPAVKGHYQGAETLKDIALLALKNGVKCVSAFVFSTENWSRSKSEVSYLMRLIVRFIENNLEEYAANEIKVVHLGSRDGLPKEVLAALDKAARRTKDFTKGTLALCVNYGGQQEIVDAAQKILRHNLDPRRLSIKELEKYLYEPDVPPLDLIVRTSGEYRTSGFMMWRAAYAEYVFVDKYWPDFSREDLKMVLLHYAKRQRRFGS